TSSTKSRSAPQHLERVDAGVVPIRPLGRQSVAAHRVHLLQGRLLLAELRIAVHVTCECPFARAVRAGAGASKPVPFVLGELAVVPRHAAQLLGSDYFPVRW